MKRDERQRLRAITEEISSWVDLATGVRAQRAQAANAAVAAKTALRNAVVEVRRDDKVAWRVLPLRASDRQSLEAIARYDALPRISESFREILARLTKDVAGALDDVRAVSGARRLFSRSSTRDSARAAADFLIEYHHWFISNDLPATLNRFATQKPRPVGPISVANALADRVGLARRIADLGKPAELFAANCFAGFRNATGQIRSAAAKEAQCRSSVVDAGNEVRRAETTQMISAMKVDRLREATRERIRTAPLTQAGLLTVSDVLGFRGLESLPGLGPTGATRIRGAAQTLWQTTYDEMPVRIDIKQRTVETTKLLRCLRVWDHVRKHIGSTADMTLAQEMSAFANALDESVTHAIVFCVAPSSVQEFRTSVDAVIQRARLIADAENTSDDGDCWDDFLSRPADYFALLSELGFITEDEAKVHGDLPEEIVEAVRGLELKTEYLRASLRGYQSFGARFALVQRKVIIGDEMGLGKTVEAIAVLAHLRARGSHHFLVICPAAVVTNWMREVASKSTLPAHRLHGLDRDAAANYWRRKGGVAVTTFESLNWLHANVMRLDGLGCVVIDEAHYIKNPDARRTRNSVRLIESCDRAVFLTGTPLENRIEEFQNLVSYLQPQLVIDAGELAPRKFRRQVAPAYLRRNQEDVLTELPELVEVDEWLTLSKEDSAAYRTAVAAGNFMAMRQAAMTQGRHSRKMQRLHEIVEEAEDNGRRVVVFSYFREVLELVARAMPGRVFGPITGSVPPAKRQHMIDQYSAAQRGAVLVAQIVAGGVGLNIQAASVVVICEPQLKPTTEWQAIARARRMGQLESVQVHRLLSEEGVDQRIREILARKSELFEEFARISETAGSAPEAYDVSEAELAREIIAAERERLFAQASAVADSQAASDHAHSDSRRDPLPSNKIAAGSNPRPMDDAVIDRSSKPPTSPPVEVGVRAEVQSDFKARRDEDEATSIVESAAANAVDSIKAGSLTPYRVFDERFPAISATPLNVIAANVARIVKVEGPVMGWRIHQVYKQMSTGHEGHDQFSRQLNRGISLAEKRRLVISDNPLGQAGNKPRTFRLPDQPKVVMRQLGPRTIDIVPPAELKQYFAEAANGRAPSEEQLLRRVASLLGLTQLTDQDKKTLLTARKLPTTDKSSTYKNAKGASQKEPRAARDQAEPPTRSPFYDWEFVKQHERRR